MNTRAVLSLAAVLVLAGCKKEAPPPPPAPTINVVTIHTTDYAFAAPESIPAGVTTIQLVNAGPSYHHVQLLRIDSGRTFDSVVAAFRGPPAQHHWMVDVGGPNAPAVGDTSRMTLTLQPGHYAMICFIPDTTGMPHFAKGMIKAIEVTAATGAMAAEPTADVEIHLTDYTFTESAPLTAGMHTIKVTNDAAQSHEMFLARVDSGSTAAQVATWGEHNLKGRAPHVRAMGGSSALAPGSHAFIMVNLTPGDYALICFAPAPDGKPHTQHGMVKQIHVS